MFEQKTLFKRQFCLYFTNDHDNKNVKVNNDVNVNADVDADVVVIGCKKENPLCLVGLKSTDLLVLFDQERAI